MRPASPGGKPAFHWSDGTVLSQSSASPKSRPTVRIALASGSGSGVGRCDEGRIRSPGGGRCKSENVNVPPCPCHEPQEIQTHSASYYDRAPVARCLNQFPDGY